MTPRRGRPAPRWTRCSASVEERQAGQGTPGAQRVGPIPTRQTLHWANEATFEVRNLSTPVSLRRTFGLDESQSGISVGDIPDLMRVRQHFSRPREGDIAAAARREVAPFLITVRPGQRVAITGSSRGIPNLAAVVREVANAIREAGAEPFVVPGMGSHGGATSAGQAEVLANNGITEKTVRAPIHSSMDVIRVGTTSTGFPVYLDRNASEADGIVVVNRVKPHTGFTGKVESGLCKMMVIGLGKQAGAQKIHQQGLEVEMQRMILEASRIVLEHSPAAFLGGIALVDNAFKETALVRGVSMRSHETLVDEEGALLETAYGYLPRIPFENIDTLIVDEMGKNVSGAGMDTNVIGTKPGLERPCIGAIYVRSLTPQTHGNATGIGQADVMPRRLLEEIDFHATYMNTFTAKRLAGSKMPLMAENDLQAMQVCLTVRAQEDPATARVVRIRNTNLLAEIDASPALRDEIEAQPFLEIVEEAEPLRFDEQGDFA